MRLYKIFVFFFCFFSIGFLSAVNYYEMFLQANEKYKIGQFKEAKELYEKIPNKGAKVNFNLGNCYFKLGKLGFALLHYRKAERQWGTLERNDLLHNISLVKKLSGHKSDNNRYFDLFFSYMNSVSLFYLQVFFLFSSFLFFLFMRFRFIKFFYFLLFVIIVSLSLIVFKLTVVGGRVGVVTESNAIIYSGPNENFTALSKLSNAQELEILDENGLWFKIISKNQKGWVKKDSVKEV
jgi:tetratricopeptide (TPR) repeat protein